MGDVLDDLKNKINDMLDVQFQICHKYTSIVMLKYKELIAIFSAGEAKELSVYKELIAELGELISKEYEAYEKLLVYDKASLIPKIDSFLASDSASIDDMRFRNKLQFTKNVFNGFKIRANELGLDDIPNYLRFDIYSSILASIYIKVFKCIKDKIDSLVYNDADEESFGESLYKELCLKCLYRYCSNDLFEIVGILNDMDISNFPDISMEVLKKYLSKIYYNTDVAEHINEILFDLIVEDLHMMSKYQQLENCADDILNYLYFVTKLDIILSYMDKSYLQKLYNYCNNIGFNNVYISSDIKRKIKRRIDIEK